MINGYKMVRWPALAAGMAALALVAGCDSGDASASGGDAPASSAETTGSAQPEIDDPAVAAAALRSVDPCALLSETTLAELGTVEPDSASTSEWGECGVDVNDASGKTIELVLRVGDQIILVDDPTEELEGLPLVVDDDQETCWVSVVTSYEQSLSISFQVDYVGGDACAAGTTALTKVVQTLRGQAPQYQQPAGTVLTADPCAVADKKAVETALDNKTFVEPKNLHQCDFWSGDTTSFPQVSVRFYQGLPPDPATDGEPVDLGAGVSAVQVKDEDTVISCAVQWRHLETPKEDEAEGYGELVSVMYSDQTESGLDTAAACEKAVAVARTVAPALGK